MKGLLILLKRELKSITREKTIMFAILIQFLIASLSSVILVGIMAFYDPSSISDNAHARLRVGIVEDVSNSNPLRGMMGGMLQMNHIRSVPFPDQTAAEEAFKAGQVDAVMVIPAERGGVMDMKLILPQLDTKQTVVMMMLQEPLKAYETLLRLKNGIKLNYADIGGKPSNSYEFLYSIIIPVLMLFPALIAGSIMIDSVSEEFQNKTFDTLMSSPVSLAQVFGAKIAAAVLTAFAQVLLWTGLLRLNGFTIQNPAMVVLIAVGVAAGVSLVAAFVALIFKDRERAQFIYSMVLVVLVAGSYFLGSSPLNLITRTASGAPYAGGMNVTLTALMYLVGLGILGGVFFKVSKRLVFSRQ